MRQADAFPTRFRPARPTAPEWCPTPCDRVHAGRSALVSSRFSPSAGIWLQGFGVLICGHGSRTRLAVDESPGWPPRCAIACPRYRWNTGYWKFPHRPNSCATASKACASKGVDLGAGVPGMLFAAATPRTTSPPFSTPTRLKTGPAHRLWPRTGHRSKMIPAAPPRIPVTPSFAAPLQTFPSLHTPCWWWWAGSSGPGCHRTCQAR